MGRERSAKYIPEGLDSLREDLLTLEPPEALKKILTYLNRESIIKGLLAGEIGLKKQFVYDCAKGKFRLNNAGGNRVNAAQDSRYAQLIGYFVEDEKKQAGLISYIVHLQGNVVAEQRVFEVTIKLRESITEIISTLEGAAFEGVEISNDSQGIVTLRLQVADGILDMRTRINSYLRKWGDKVLEYQEK